MKKEDTPLWQLEENRKGMDHQMTAALADIERTQARVVALREKMAQYDEAIARLKEGV